MLDSTIAHYKVTAKIGQGGMGEVYRATDSKLDREVAIKVLPESFAQDKERLARFEREAKMLASLNHPNIASIYGLEGSDGKKALVLELVEGETLTERLRTGAMPIEESLDICKQIAEALEAAHEKGIIHRDLKPGNIKITPDGKVKVLDFGLAKSAIADSSVAPSDNSQSPTLTADYTRPGVILGTAAYMSPEQARAKPVDKRSDIWSFGCVLYECLTGKCLFRGEDVTETLATVIKGEPQWTDLPTDTPLIVQLLIRKCLVKDRKGRLRDIGDALVDLTKAIADPNWGVESGQLSSASSAQGISKSVLAMAYVVTGIITLALGWFLKPTPSSSPAQHPKFTVPLTLDPDLQLGKERGGSLALSKDGQQLVFTTRSPTQVDQNTPQLHWHSFASDEYKVIQGTESAYAPFFSPDGRQLGFFTDGTIQTVPISGGKPKVIVRPPWGQMDGAAWGKNGFIIYSPMFGGLMKVADSGGKKATPLTTLDTDEFSHGWPQFLPDGRHVIFTVVTWGNNTPPYIKIVDVQNPDSPTKIIPKGSFARYVESGHIIYLLDDGWLHAVRFDAQKLKVVGLPKRLNPVQTSGWRNPQFAVAETAGTLAYLPGTGEGFTQFTRRLAWVGEGVDTNQNSIKYSGKFLWPSLSPDDRQVAVEEDGNILIVDLLGQKNKRRLTVHEGNDTKPLWSGEWIIFSSYRSGKPGLWRRKADGTGEPELILENEENLPFTQSVSADGKLLVYSQYMEKTGWDPWIKNMEDEKDQGKPLLDSRFTEGMPSISPNGQSIAYHMNQGHGGQIYLRKIGDSGSGMIVSSDGGSGPLWSAEGDKLFYQNKGAIWAVDITQKEGGYESGKPKEIVQLPEGVSALDWNVSSDGKRFLVSVREGGEENETPPEEGPNTIKLIFNFFTELNEKVPVE